MNRGHISPEEARKKYLERHPDAKIPNGDPNGNQDDPNKSNADDPSKKPENSFDWNTVSDEMMFGRLSEKSGREIKSWEDLIQTKEIEKIVQPELSPEVEAFNKYHNETGRGFNDFMDLNRNWKEESEDAVLKEMVRRENPHLSQEDIDFLYNDSFKVPKKLDGDDYTEEEIQANDHAIKKSQIYRKSKVASAIEQFEESKKTYLDPIETKKQELAAKSQAGREAWKEKTSSAMEALKGFEVDGFNYEFRDKDQLKESFSSVEGILGRYRNDQGELDHGKLFKVLMVGEQAETMMSAYKTHVESEVKRSQLENRVNPNLETDRTKNPSNEQDEKARRIEHARNALRPY